MASWIKLEHNGLNLGGGAYFSSVEGQASCTLKLAKGNRGGDEACDLSSLKFPLGSERPMMVRTADLVREVVEVKPTAST